MSFIIIEGICKSALSRQTKKKLPKLRENVWVIKLETLTSKGPKQELNK